MSTGRVMADPLVRFVRGLGMARSGDLAAAKREVNNLQDLRTELEKSGQPYWADRTHEQILAVAAWVAYAEGARDEATKLMRAAEAAGDRQKAVAYSEKLVALSSKADTARPELARAKDFLGRR